MKCGQVKIEVDWFGQDYRIVTTMNETVRKVFSKKKRAFGIVQKKSNVPVKSLGPQEPEILS